MPPSKPRSVIEKDKPGATVINVLMRARGRGAPFDGAWQGATVAALLSVSETRRAIVARDLNRQRDVYASVYAGLGVHRPSA